MHKTIRLLINKMGTVYVEYGCDIGVCLNVTAELLKTNHRTSFVQWYATKMHTDFMICEQYQPYHKSCLSCLVIRVIVQTN